jgi:hypothetical protein
MNQHDREVIRGFHKYIKQQTKEVRERRSAAARRFLDYLREGIEMEDAKRRVCTAFDLTDRQLRNIIAGRALLTKDGAVDMQAKVQRVVARAEEQIDRISEHLNEVLEDIDQAERDGVERYELEYESVSGEKASVKTKSVPLAEARFIIMKRYMGELKVLTSMIKDLVPDHVINTTIYNTIDQKEVENEVMALIKRNRLSDDTFKESK